VILPHVNWLELGWGIPLSQEFLVAFFAMIPNVRELEVGNTLSTQDWEVFVEALYPLNVRTISLPFNAQPGALWGAIAADDSIFLDNTNTNSDNDLELLEAQEELLRSQSTSLEVLNLMCFASNRNYGQPRLDFPVMENLKTLTLSDNMSYPIDDLVPDQLPKLQTLQLGPRTLASRIFEDTVFSSVLNINLITLNSYNIRVLGGIGARFPCVKKLTNLEIHLDTEAMENIVTNLRCIEYLELKILNCDKSGPMKNINLVISGFPVQSGFALNQLADRVGYATLPSWIQPPGKSLRDLTSK